MNAAGEAREPCAEGPPLAIAEPHAVTAPRDREREMLGQLHRAGAVVGEMPRRKDVQPAQVVGHGPFMFAPVGPRMVAAVLTKSAVAQRLVAVVAHALDGQALAPFRTLSAEPPVTPVPRERQDLIHTHRVYHPMPQSYRCDPHDPIPPARALSHLRFAAREREPPIKRIWGAYPASTTTAYVKTRGACGGAEARSRIDQRADSSGQSTALTKAPTIRIPRNTSVSLFPKR